VKPSKPFFRSVIDLGLRDVGVRSDPRRLAKHFGKAVVPLVALHVVFIAVTCAVLRQTGADTLVVVAFALASTAAVFAVALHTVKRSPGVIVKVTAEGTNQATWHVIAPFALLALATLPVWDPRLVPVIVLALFMAVLLWRARGALPEVLRTLRPLLAADERVLGDGIGVVRGVRRPRDAFRLVVATDRRLLVAASTRSTLPFLLVDVPYARVSRFGVEWKHLGRVGELSLTVAGDEGAPSETHVIGSMAPANLMSVAQALQSHGVHADDPVALSEAEAAWEEAQRSAWEEVEPQGKPRERLIERAAMSTREFDRGLWLLLGLSAAAIYLNPYDLGLRTVLVVAVLCVVCGYISGTSSSLAYVVPLNLLLSPVFLFADAGEVISLMIVLSAAATIGLWAGAALRRAAAGPVDPPGEGVASPAPTPARGSLRYALGGLGLVRISGMMLAAVLAVVATAAAAGFELTSLRLAVDEVIGRQLPVDGRSNLTGNAASLTYTPGPDLREFVTDEDWGAGPNDGARWELRSSFHKGYNVVSLAHYVFQPPLDDAKAVAAFVADKDREHSRVAGYRVPHTERIVDGRKGYVWNHGDRRGYWIYAAWFPRPRHNVRVECVARGEVRRFKQLCAQAMRSLEFH
jgi:hypothetical protein